jgi:hypothetical protein
MSKINTFVTYLIEQEIFEDKVDVILSKQGDKIFDAYKADKGASKPKCKDAKDVIDHLSEISKEYLQWLVTRYCAGQFYLEDKGKLEFVTQNFKKVAKKLEFNDINRYKDVAALEAEMLQFSEDDMKSGKQKAKEENNAIEQEFIKKKKAIIYYDEGPIKVVIPKSEEASKYFGKGTRWCTAAENNNMFKRYSIGKNVLYIITLRGDSEKYQIHFKTKQFMNTEDRPVTGEELVELCVKYPKLTEIFNTQAREGDWPALFTKDAAKFETTGARHDFSEEEKMSIVLYKIKSKTLTDELREYYLTSNVICGLARSKFGFASKEFKELVKSIAPSNEDKIMASVIDAKESSTWGANAETICETAKAMGLSVGEEYFTSFFKGLKKENAGSYHRTKNYKFIADMIGYNFSYTLPKDAVKAVMDFSPEFYLDSDMKLEILELIFEHLTDDQKQKAVTTHANILKKDTKDKIPAKWKNRASWKPALKI